MVHWWRRQDRHWYPWWRLANGLVAILLVAAIVLPVWQNLYNNDRYKLSDQALTLVGQTDQTLQKQLTYDQTTATYQFNKAAVPTDQSGNPLTTMQAQVGTADGQGDNKSLYALDVPADFKQGVTYHDVNSGLSFSLVPQFSALPGKTVSGHLVFPLNGGPQTVYTLKNNGLKEDIVLNKTTSDSLSFSYEFKLPDTLAVKVIPNGDGAIGIYSADPSLFGNVSYGSDADRASLEKARAAADKTYLVFGLPKPVIKDTKGSEVGSARYELNGDKLTVVAEGLSAVQGPVTIDPSVVVTSASDFATGANNEGNIMFDAANNQISRNALTGGTLNPGSETSTAITPATWTSNTNKFTTGRSSFGSVVYNGYMYVLGGNDDSSHYLNDVQYAAINSDGTVGTWQSSGIYATNGRNFLA